MQLAVPTIFRPMLMTQAHAAIYAGHLGTRAVVAKLALRFYWPGMHEDVKQFVEQCIPCARYREGPNRRAPLRPVRALAPFHMVAVDVVGPLRETLRGNKYIVCFVDYYTKWLMAFATPDQTASTMVKLLCKQIIPEHGVLRIVISDNGPCFIATEFREACQ